MTIYSLSIVGVLLVCLLSVGLAIYAGMSKGRAGLLAGPVQDMRDDNPLYRIDRVHMNSVEALGPFAAAAVLAMLAGVDATVLAGLVWLHAGLRVVHAFIYLRGGGLAKGGKLRTILYVLSALVTIAIIAVAAWSAMA
jgi:uncharacterized MAPEG superfamily protein